MESNAANLTIDSASTSERSGFVKIPWISRIGYGLADSSCNIVYGMINTLLTLFYTDYVGISFVTVGLVMLISRFFDGSSDVIMGVLVSKTRSPLGEVASVATMDSTTVCHYICSIVYSAADFGKPAILVHVRDL